MTTSVPYGLGRTIEFDEASRSFNVRELLEKTGATTPRSFTWAPGAMLNQGTHGTCVGHGWAGELSAKPDVIPTTEEDALRIYREAGGIISSDPSKEGASVLGGAKAVQAEGHMPEYRWAFNLDDLILAVGHHGPAVLGVNWYSNMFNPDAKGLITVAGSIEGGHCILARGVNIKAKQFRLRNSWGTSWGVGGDCYISFDDLQRLLNEQGEACIPVHRS